MHRTTWLVAWALLLTACGSGPKRPPTVPAERPAVPFDEVSDGAPSGPLPVDLDAIPEPVPRSEPRSRYGNHSPYTVLGRTYRVMDSAEGYVERGMASWYGTKFHGRPTSSFEPYDMYQYTAAHKTLPLPSYVKVTNLDNGRSVVVRVNDRGPFKDDRIIDLSYVAAMRLDMHLRGTARVEVRALKPEHAEPGPTIAVHDADARIFVQVGAFSERDNARRARDRLRDAGVEGVRLTRVRTQGRTFWRVRLGPLANRTVAERELANVRRLGFGAAQILSL
ncbi:MAG TPA: septal ring lytic transglycosylase RlpA family protein [Xanthomonadaceae bacterium]|nr:septal ring lytic transglycosylase RlpA family protein [Xanthomonadaceae bacterium]